MMFFWTHCGQDTETWTTEVGSAQTIKFYREFMTKSNLKIPHQDLCVDIFFWGTAKTIRSRPYHATPRLNLWEHRLNMLLVDTLKSWFILSSFLQQLSFHFLSCHITLLYFDCCTWRKGMHSLVKGKNKGRNSNISKLFTCFQKKPIYKINSQMQNI
jgi:hypothetical protein